MLIKLQKMSKERLLNALPVLLLVSSLFFQTTGKSQVVWENHNNEIYHFLYRMAQKGIIDFDDNIRPVSRIYLQNCLDSLSSKNAVLSKTEQNELSFYLQEYTDKNLNEKDSPPHFLKKDTAKRWRMLDINTNHFMLRMDPVFTAAAIESNVRHVQQYSSGVSLYGYAGKHWSYYFSYNDVNEKGTGIDTLRAFTPESGIVTKIASNKQSHNYSELRGGITYNFKNGSISFAQDQVLQGYGDNGRIILSDKAPAYPFIKLDYKPLRWLSFNYMHAWLNSGIIDSAKTYPTGIGTITYGAIREIFIPKFFAIHSINITPSKGLDVTLGESIVYSDKMDAGYLIPILFYKVYDNIVNNNNINAGSNGQLFLQVSSRNHLRNTHLYGSLFIDEIRISSIFDKTKSRNQLGYTVGASMTDIAVPYLTMGIEYTRINPFVYRNLLPAQDYSSSRYSLGDWMGNNADRFIYTIRYTPIAKLKLLFRYQSIRKGGAGTLDQQYFQQPQPPFLFDLQFKQTELDFQASYEWINRLNFYWQYNARNTKNYITNSAVANNQLTLGVRYGL